MLDKSTLDAVFLGIILIWLLIAICITFVFDECYRDLNVSFADILNGLGSKYRFKTKSMRTAAEQLYEYKVHNEFDNTKKVDISILLQKNKVIDPPPASSLTDVCLHKLSTSKDDFNKLMYFVPIFNNPIYPKVIQSYNSKTKTFKNFDKNKSTKRIIIDDLLNINEQSIVVDNPSIDETLLKRIINDVNTFLNDEWIYQLLKYANDNKFLS